MKSVWVIEQGCYSDYRVVGVFSSKQNAELAMSMMEAGNYGDGPSIEEWDLDPHIDKLNQGLRAWVCDMLRDGTVERCTIASFDIGEETSINICERSQWMRTPPLQDCLRGVVWAKGSTHAIKIVNEYRTQMIAENKWKEPSHAD